MKNIVVLADKYYPDMSAPSAVLDKYIQELKGDYNFHVITITYRKEFEPFPDKRIKLHYITSFWHERRVHAEESFRKNPKDKWAWIEIQFFRLRSLLLSYFSYPMCTKWQIKEYNKVLKRISNEINIDTVISVSNTVITQFAVKDFKKEHPEIKWITFFTDPFTFHYIYYPRPYPFKKFREKRNYKNELDIYNTADYNMLVEDLYGIALEKFHQPKNKTFQIKFVLQDIKELIGNKDSKIISEDVRLVYAGALYKDIRNPEYMLSVISKVYGVTLDLYTSATTGNECGDIIEKYLSDSIHTYPPKDRAGYLEMISNDYDILINIGNNSPNQTPSKTLELLSTGRPILNFYYKKDGQYDMIEKYPLGLNVGRDDTNAVAKVEDFCNRMKGERMAFEEVESLYPENALSSQVQLLKKLIDE